MSRGMRKRGYAGGLSTPTAGVIIMCALLSVCGVLSFCADGLAGSPLGQWLTVLIFLGIGTYLLAGVVGIGYAVYRVVTCNSAPASYPVPANVLPFYPPKMVKPVPVYRSPVLESAQSPKEKPVPVYMAGSKKIIGWEQPDGSIIWESNRPIN
jgi:hypothetical protein